MKIYRAVATHMMVGSNLRQGWYRTRRAAEKALEEIRANMESCFRPGDAEVKNYYFHIEVRRARLSQWWRCADIKE